MAVVNLSTNSTYHSSIATSVDMAVDMGVAAMSAGAHLVDIGAESTTASADRVEDERQLRALLPVVEGLVTAGVPVSVESYSPSVVARVLEAGARTINLTGRADDDTVFSLAADANARMVISFTRGRDVKQNSAFPTGSDAIAEVRAQLAARAERAVELGVTKVVIDPGLGFTFANLTDPKERADHQGRMLLASHDLTALGFGICQSLPHARVYFGDEYRTAEAFYATLALMGGATMLRTHEVARVAPVVNAVRALASTTAPQTA